LQTAARCDTLEGPSSFQLSRGFSCGMNQDLLDLLVCPEDHSRLHFAEVSVVHKLNAAIAAGRLKNRGGAAISSPIEAALVRVDGKLAYPVIGDIPHMLIDEAIPLDQLLS
jgi:uncharacterized protein YbaR (Trm112 family)